MHQTPRPAADHDPCPDPLTQVVTVEQLADRLGIRPATVRQHLSAGTAAGWLPQPDGRINGGAVWRASSLVGIEDRRRRPGRPARPATDAAAPPAAPTVTVTAAVGDADGWWDAGSPCPVPQHLDRVDRPQR
jgi:hypothetical protein